MAFDFLHQFFRSNRAPSVTPAESGRGAWHMSSYAEPNGRVFLQDGRVFRGIPAGHVDFCTKLLADGVVGSLVSEGLLVPTVKSDHRIEGFPMVLEHEAIPHVSFPFEWPGETLREAARFTLTLLQRLADHGLTLKDAHGWNVLFRQGRPVYVDFGSIVTAATAGEWNEYVEQEFQEFFLHPLLLLAAGRHRVARALMREFDRGISRAECESLLTGTGVALTDAGVRSFASYREVIEALDLRPVSLGWSGYYDGEFPALTPGDDWTPKHHAVHAVLRDRKPGTVLDIGCNRGWYAMLAAKLGATVTAFDNDEDCVGRLLTDAREAQLDVQPLVMSCLNPAPRFGLGEGLMPSAAERLRSDLVLALAMVHHMVFKMHLGFEQIADGLAAYTGKTLVVELPPADDIHVSQWMTPRYAWYTRENFERALRRHFRRITVVDSHPRPRMFLICDR